MAIVLVADLAGGTEPVHQPPFDDETMARRLASRAPGSAEVIVAQGRARAHQLLRDPDFRALTESLAARLLELQELTGVEVEGFLARQLECRGALQRRLKTSRSVQKASAFPFGAEGAVAHSAAQGTGGAGLLGPPSNWGRRPPSAPESLTGNPGGGRLV